MQATGFLLCPPPPRKRKKGERNESRLGKSGAR
jgi:hypothetical protein